MSRPPRPSRRRAPVARAPRESARPAARSSSRRELGGDQVEGRQAVRELLLAGRRKVHEVWIASDDGRGPLADLAELAAKSRVLVKHVSAGKLAAAARSESPQGVLARCAPLEETDLDEMAKRTKRAVPFLVAVDGVTDPGNLGALLRAAECAGATGVVLPRHRSVHVTPTVAKAAAGAIEHLPMAVVSGLPAAIERLKAAGVWVV
ncbi:MAG: rRNA (guanosine2251-2-O)-methyltransferase, partial [Gaiellaceae bacterium]|nr:rRNA (guanosine2251-2-O)-methyltransferase [Gaiellaceae bacterium]